MTLRTLSTERTLVWALIGALAISMVAIEAPAEAQRSSLRARRARARRARRARIARQNRIEQSGPVDMDFTSPLAAIDDERPPPMDISYVREHETRTLERRRAALDPELFGEASERTHAATPRERARFSPLTARAALRVFHRGLDYRDYARGAVTPYVLPLGAGLAIGSDYYPAAHLLNDAWAHVGLTWSLTHSLGVESVGPNGVGYPTTAYAWQLGVRVRVPLDDGGEVAFEAGGGEHGFRVERGHLQDPSPEGVPGADYDLLRFAVSGRVMVGDASLGGRVGYLPVLSSGAIGSAAYFGAAEVHGVEAGIEFTYRLGLGFEVLAEVDARLFVLSFPEASDAPAAAAGALDRTIGANLGLRWTMPSEQQL